MRIWIFRTRMVTATDPGTMDVAYDIGVPIADCPGDAGSEVIRYAGDLPPVRYRDYPDATWVPSLPPGWERYGAWLEHEKRAHEAMLAMLHEHCPETRHLSGWPLLWARIDAGADLSRIEFEIDRPRLGPARPAERS